MLGKPTIKYRLQFAKDMPKGLKETSSLITIGFEVAESAANTFTQNRVDLQLNPLDNEVFVVQAIDITLTPPEAIAATDTAFASSVTTTSQTAVAELDNSNCMAVAVNQIRAGGFVDGGVGFTQSSGESPSTTLDYIAIIATNDFFCQILGANNAGTGRLSGKLYGYRAKADAAVYAALVQSEVLSS